jgi:uncharacterized protein involved in exopolysaccharide biosynthesis
MKQSSAEAVLLRGGGGAQPSETRVMTIERELASARATYTDKHPEIQRLQDELAAARRDEATERQRPTSDRLASLQADPAYRQLLSDRELARLRIGELEHAAAETQRQIALYQGRVEAAPMVEQQLSALQRDYDLEKVQYSELSAKLRASTIAENVERNGGGEQFAVLYPASLPAEPSKPLPSRIFLLSILGGLSLGCALMLGREYFDRSVHDVRDLKTEFDVPVLGEVTRIEAA